ncbi:MAG: hypothetical protein WD000_08895 [Thermodesulfobacteriota bacterium]
MSETKINIVMTGPEGHTELLRLNDFIGLLRVVTSGLEHLNYIVSANKANKLKFAISNLSHSSPYTVALNVRNTEKKLNTSQIVVDDYINGIITIESNSEVPSYFDFQLLENIRKLSTLKKKHFSDIAITNTDASVQITNQLESHIDIILGGDIIAYGSVRGMLERVNVHNNINKSYIYPSIGSSRIECKFDDEMFEKTKQGLKRYVNVNGKVFYKAISKYPYKIIADSIDIYPPENELPTLGQLRGIEPNLTGEMTTYDFIRHIREEDE